MRFNKAALFRILSVVVLASSVASKDCTDPGTIDTYVVIIGAGMAGLFAGKTLMKGDPDLDFVILESQARVGGRMHSTQFGTKAGGGTYTVEEGANWFADVPHNSALNLAREYGIDMTLQDWFDFVDSTYEYDHKVNVSVREKEPPRNNQKISPRVCNDSGKV
jgi:monoamine oxidase